MNSLDVYLYGMSLVSTIHKLDGPYPAADGYQEIDATYYVPGGETANAAIILAHLGLTTKVDGPFLGTGTAPVIHEFGKKYGIDFSGMVSDVSFEGLRDFVLVDSRYRTVFGYFRKFLFGSEKRWTLPDRSAIECAKIVSVDPFFGDESLAAAQYCRECQKEYVTIDCHPESPVHRHAAATVISGEFRNREYPDIDPEMLFTRYVSCARGLVIFTSGSRDIVYGRKDGDVNRCEPFKVRVQGTLGAGDSFRAGIVFGMLNGWSDDRVVRFGAAVAAAVCKRFPVALYPPTREEIDIVLSQ